MIIKNKNNNIYFGLFRKNKISPIPSIINLNCVWLRAKAKPIMQIHEITSWGCAKNRLINKPHSCVLPARLRQGEKELCHLPNDAIKNVSKIKYLEA
jgi:hypothetical protein